MNSKNAVLLLLSTLVAGSSAFSAPKPNNAMKTFDPVMPAITAQKNKAPAAFLASAALLNPMIAQAVEDPDYEYGAVDAPIGVAWGAGIVVILTAAVPVFMQGGEEAFNEMKELDSDKWGSGNSDRLNSRK